MKPIDIYVLTRMNAPEDIKKAERHMSGRTSYLHVKPWEVRSLKLIVEQLMNGRSERPVPFDFYYSFQIPRLGKEFDLLRISEDTIINIELKSRPVEEESILKQLLINRYYLSFLGRTMRFFTYISSENKLYRMSNNGHLVSCGIGQLIDALTEQGPCKKEDIENYFRTEEYIISPLSDPDRFLRGDYFLTSQQRDIERRILRRIKETKTGLYGINGLPGTGKTLLLYDIIMRLSEKNHVLMIHCGKPSHRLEELNRHLKRIDIWQIKENTFKQKTIPENITAICMDEVHFMDPDMLSKIVREIHIPLIVSYDRADCVSDEETDKRSILYLTGEEKYEDFRLTNRIRSNAEISSFIQCLMCPGKYKPRMEYPHVDIAFAANRQEADVILEHCRQEGFTLLGEEIPSDDFESVVMEMDAQFFYDANGFLRYERGNENRSPVENLFRGFNRAKYRIFLLVIENEKLFSMLLSLVQR